jgi:hypothetical protein
VFCSARLQLEKLRQKMAREGQGVTHKAVEGSAAHRLMEKHVRTWDQFVAIDLAATSEPTPSILLVDVQFPGNVGAIVRNCGLCGFGRVLLLSTEEGGSRGSELYSKAFLKTALQKSLAHKYDWDFQLVIGRSLVSFQFLSRFSMTVRQLVNFVLLRDTVRGRSLPSGGTNTYHLTPLSARVPQASHDF